MLSLYIQEWANFDSSLEKLESKEAEYYSSALTECEQEYVIIGDVRPSLRLFNRSLKALTQAVESNWELSPDKTLVQVLQLTLQLLKCDKEDRIKFLEQCVEMADPSRTFYPLLESTLGGAEYQNVIGIQEFYNPNRNNAVRSLVVRMEDSKLNAEVKITFLQNFLGTAPEAEEDSNSTISGTFTESQEFLEHFSTLLSPSEKIHFNEIRKTTVGEFKLPDNITKHPDWESEFKHANILNLFRNLLIGFDQEKKEISKALEESKERICGRGKRNEAKQ